MRPHLLRHIIEICAKDAAPQNGLHSIVRQSGFAYAGKKESGPFTTFTYNVDKKAAQQAVSELNSRLLRGKFPASTKGEDGSIVWSKPGHKFIYKAGTLTYRIMDMDAQARAQRMTNQRKTIAADAEPAISAIAREVMWQLFDEGTTWDGNLVAKGGRDELKQAGYVQTIEGWNFLTDEGMRIAVQLGMDKRKDAKQQPRIVQKPISPVLASEKNVGRSWQSPDGKRTVEGITTIKSSGEKRYLVRTEGERTQDLIGFDELEIMIKRDESNVRFRAEQAKKQAESDRKEQERRSLDGFENTLNERMRARAISALCDKGITVNGRFYPSIRDAIRALLANYRPEEYNGQMVFVSRKDEDVFLNGKPFTKFGMDYAVYLSKRK